MDKQDSIPKTFWAYFDLFRRQKITIDEYSALSGIEKKMLMKYLKKNFANNQKKEK